MKTTCRLLLLLFLVSGAASGQVAPAATVPGGSSLQYALRYAQTGRFATSIPNQQASSASGSLTYMSGSERYPFTVEYGGGYAWTISGPSYGDGQSQRIFLSQGINWRKWTLMASDDASYLPMTPTTGFLGIPGIGEPIGVTNPTPPSGQSILSLNTHVVENNASGSLGHSLGNATTVSASGNHLLLRFPNGDGLDTNSLSGTGMIMRVLNGRNSLTGTYNYYSYSYPGFNVTFATNSALIGFQHKWTRNLTTDIAAGPQFISSSVSTIVPSSTNVSVNASVNYLMRFTSASAIYSRGTNGGAGYLLGAEVDNFAGNLSRQFGMNATIGLTGGYQRTTGLNNNGTTDGFFGGAEGTWRIGRNMIVFANYTGMSQSTTSALPTTALNQLMHTIGFGVGFSPRPKRVRQ
jgi:hypothetical protein